MNHDREYFGEWKVDPPKPSPGPWSFKEAREYEMSGVIYSYWVVLDANGKEVCECENAINAQHIARNGPGTEAEGAPVEKKGRGR